MPHLPVVELDAETAARVRHGRPLATPVGIRAPVVALLADGRLVAVAEPEGDRLHPRVVLQP